MLLLLLQACTAPHVTDTPRSAEPPTGPVEGHDDPDGGSRGETASSGDVSETGDPRPHDAVVFLTEEVLVPDGQPALTGNVRRADLGWAPGVELLVAEPERSLLTHLSGCSGTCELRDVPLPGGTVPVRTAVADLDADGLQDVVVVDIGVLWPSKSPSGRVLVLRGDGTEEVALSGVGRTACAEPGDLDGDGDLDLTVCAFGHVEGSVGWLERDAGGWRHHVIEPLPGAIHAFPSDVDDDGDLDVLAVLSQHEERVVLYRNDGLGGFTTEVLLQGPDSYYGLSGIEPVDLDGDGDPDVLVTQGDTMDLDLPPTIDPDAYHGVGWLENDGTGAFMWHDLLRVWGAYAVRAADLDLDGDLDVVVATDQFENLWPDLPQRPIVWLENLDGTTFAAPRTVAAAPPHLMTLEIADVDEDGDVDLLTGSMDLFTHTGSRLVLLRNQLR